MFTITVLAGCSATPTPTPTTTPAFASEEEAFAAAEETYQAYNDALNAVDLSDPSSFEPVFALLSGTAEATTRKAFSEFHAAKMSTVGATRYDSFAGESANLESGSVTATVCVDVAEVEVFNELGESAVSSDRPDRQPMLITFERSTRALELRLSAQSVAEEVSCAQ